MFMFLNNIITKTISCILIVCQIGLLFHNIAYAAPANSMGSYDSVRSGHEFGLSELEKLQHTFKSTNLSASGDLTFGDKRLDDIKDDKGQGLNVNHLSADQNDKEVADRFYQDGKAPNIQDLQGLQRSDLTEDDVNNIGFTAHDNFDKELDSKGGEASYQAHLHGMMVDSHKFAKPSFQRDPIFDSARDILSSKGNPFEDCEFDKKLISQKQKVHKSDLKDCVEQKLESCTLTHNPELSILKYADAKAVYGVCGEHCITYYLGLFPHNSKDPLIPCKVERYESTGKCLQWESHCYDSGETCSYTCKRYEQKPVYGKECCKFEEVETTFIIKNIKAIKRIAIDTVNYAGSVKVYIPAEQGGHDRALFAYNSDGSSIINKDQMTCTPYTGGTVSYPMADITKLVKENFKDGESLKFVIQYKGAKPYASLNVDFYPELVPQEDVWLGEGQCLVSAQAIYKNEIKGSVSCKRDITQRSGLVTIGGVQIEPKYLKGEFGLKGSCTLAEVKVDKTNFKDMAYANSQKLPMCSELEKKGCGFVSSKCVKVGKDASINNTCVLRQNTYDCGYDTEIAVPTEQQEYVCPGEVACMGVDCMNIALGKDPASDDFNKALGLLQQSQGAANDMSCKATNEFDKDGVQKFDCDVFPGVARQCNDWKALGGLMKNNCCSGAPVAGDWAQTTRQTLHLYKENFLRGTSVYADFKANNSFLAEFLEDKTDGSMVYGTVWDMIKKFSPIGKAEDAVLQPITNALNNLIPYAGEVFMGVYQFAQDLVVKWIMESYIMPALSHAITTALGSAASSAGGGTAGSGSFGIIGTMAEKALVEAGMSQATATAVVSAVGTALTIIGWVYAAYTITKLVFGMLTKCENEEFELQSKIKQKLCDYVGSYCDKKIPTQGCIRTKHTYCCFTSPLSRILNKQIKYGLNGCYRLWPGANPSCAFGSAKNAQCGAVTVEQMEKVDWTKIDMTEWLELLKASNAFQGDNISLDKITDNSLPVGGRGSKGEKVK